MGIDIHGLNFLRYSTKGRSLEKTITIGRQGLHINDGALRKYLGLSPDYEIEKYCEQILCGYFGASSVDSIDYSDYEHASIIHDMNQPVPSPVHRKYDTVIDGGCLEHIYNVTQALKNCSLLCKQGGQIIHILPANNFCGHGFWQFSPELFFSLYSSDHGYKNTDVFLADVTNTTKWLKVERPQNGQRVNVTSSTPLYILVRTVLAEEHFSHVNVQQSDYVFEWCNKERAQSPNPIKQNLKQGLKELGEAIPKVT